MRFKLGIIATHPIQYQAPWFKALASQPDLDIEVFFAHRPSPREQADAGFGVQFEWDTPLFEDYAYRFLPNTARNPSVHRFWGVDTPEISRIIAGGGYDAVMVSGWRVRSEWQAILACWRTRTPVMVRGDSHLFTPRSASKTALKRWAHGCFIPKFDACLAVGKWSRDYFLYYGARDDRVFVVPHVVDEKRFSEQLKQAHCRRAALRREWRLSESGIVFLFSGKFVQRKRPTDFIRALALCAKYVPGVQGLMVGDGPLRKECEHLVHDLSAPVVFAGFLNQSRVVDAYTAGDVLVLASDGAETWGLVAHEAMFCGRPCIVSDQVGCGPDLVTSGITGDTFPCGDISALAAHMVRYASNPRSIAIMGANARTRIECYSTREAVGGVRAALESVTALRQERS